MTKETGELTRDRWLMDLMESEGPIHPQSSDVRELQTKSARESSGKYWISTRRRIRFPFRRR